MKRIIKTVLGLTLVMLVANGIWFFATRQYLNSDAFYKKINTPELQFDAKKGYSPWPGFFVFEDFIYTGFSRTGTYQVKAKRLSFHFNFINLAREMVSVHNLRASDVTIHIGDGPDSDDSEAEQEQKEREEEEKEKKEGKDDELWTTVFTNAKIEHLREMKMADWLWTGDAGLITDFTVDSDGHFTLGRADIEGSDFKVVRKDKEFAAFTTAKFMTSIEKFELKNKAWRDLLPKMETHWVFKGKLHDLNSFSPYWSELKWLKLSSEPLGIDGDLGIKKGVLEEGGKLVFDTGQLNFTFLNQSISGPGTLVWNCDKTTSLALNIGQFEFNDGRDGAGKGFSLLLETPNRDLVQEWKDWDAHIKLPRTEIKRLQFLQAYIPKSVPLKLEKGVGFLEGDIRASSNAKRSKGHLTIKAQKIQANYRDKLRFEGDVNAKVRFSRLDLEKNDVTIEDAGVDVTQLSFRDQKNWNGSLHFTQARLHIAEPVTLQSQVRLLGDNLQPVLAFLILEQSFPDWIAKAFDLDKPNVNFQIAATEKTFRVRDFKAKAGDFAMEGWADESPSEKSARFLLDFKGITGAYGYEGEKSEWKIANAREWYEKVGHGKL